MIEIRNKNLISIIKLEENPKYITSDNPVNIYNINTGIIAPFDPDNELSLPVNDSYTVYLYNEEDTDLGKLTRLNYKGSMNYYESVSANALEYGSCERFILGSKENLNNFSKLIRR